MRPLLRIIDRRALRHNLDFLRQRVQPATLMAVVKANAYGHGMAAVLPVLQDVAQLAVCAIDEALTLRSLGARQDIVLLEGIFERDELATCSANNFVVVLHNERQLKWLQQMNSSLPLKIWLKFDSGMHRLGFVIERAEEIFKRVLQLPNVHCMGVLTHFASADDANDLEQTINQCAAMDALKLPTNWQRCYANSAAILSLPNAHHDWVRAGLALYGVSPFAGVVAKDLGLQNVMSYQTQVLDVHYLQRGEYGGYAHGFRAAENGYVATIAIGYGDGFPRTLTSGALKLRVDEKYFALVGKVSMDMSLLWLGDKPCKIGAKVTLWDAQSPLEQLAQAAATIPYTLVAAITQRVRSAVID